MGGVNLDHASLNELRIDRSDEPAAPGRRRLGWVVLALALFALAGWWFWWGRVAAVHTVVVRAAESASAAVALNASGYVTPRRQATVSSKVTGKVVEVAIEEGREVSADQVLARLDDSNLRTELRLTEAQFAAGKAALEETRVRLDEAEKDLRRVSDLHASHIAPATDLDRAVADVNARKAQLEKQQADIEVAQQQTAVCRQQIEDMVIRAPFAGMVTMKNAQPGEMISPISAGGGFTRTGICTIVDMSSLEIEVDVNESYINRVTATQPVEATLDAYPDWKIPARVIAIIPTADRQKATVKVRIGFDHLDPRILPDMAVKVAFRDTARHDELAGAVVLPKAAVRREDGRDVVFVVADGRVTRRAVTAGPTQEGGMLVRAGLAVGERVVVEGPEPLRDGARVREMPQ
jgi:RND family efflux transporter MFP subunit